MRQNFCLFLLLPVASFAATISYSYEDLGQLETSLWGSMQVSSLNNRGWMAGGGYGPDDQFHPARYRPGVGVELLSKNAGGAYDMNDTGTVVGIMDLRGTYRGFVWPKAQPWTDIGTLGGTHSHAYGINEAGQVVGGAYTSEGAWHAFRYTAEGGMVDLRIPGGNSTALDINESGQVLGYWNEGMGAFLYDPVTGTIDVGAIVGENFEGKGLSDNGTIVGVHQFQLVLYSTSTGVRRVGDLGECYGCAESLSINDRDWVVGLSRTPPESGYNYLHPFLYVSGHGMMDLNTIVIGLDAELREAELVEVYDINDRGQILAGANNGHYYLLSPVPEPSTWLLFGAGLTCIAVMRRRHSTDYPDANDRR